MMVQVLAAPAAMAPPERFRELAPAVPPVIVPPQVFVGGGVGATTRPAGKVSVNSTLDKAPTSAVLLVSTMVMVEVPLDTIVEGANDFAAVGASVSTRLSVESMPAVLV